MSRLPLPRLLRPLLHTTRIPRSCALSQMATPEHVRSATSSSEATVFGSASTSPSAFKPPVITSIPETATATGMKFIPADTEARNRTLVVCFDGTGDMFDTDNSNVIELFTILKKDDPSKQLVYYQAGIGTYTIPEIATPFFANMSKKLDEAIAWNIDAHIMGGYEFLMEHYTANDRICIFGFSRGAYTARCLAGMIHKIGLLPAGNHQQVPFAYKMYTQPDAKGWAQSNAFKKAFCVDVDIEFVGVWDTVASVGIIPRRLPFTASNTIIKTFRHAVSLDEHRAKFKANLWNRPEEKEKLLGISDQRAEAQKVVEGKVGKAGKGMMFGGGLGGGLGGGWGTWGRGVGKGAGAEGGKNHDHDGDGETTVLAKGKGATFEFPKWYMEMGTDVDASAQLWALEAEYSDERLKPTDVDEVWFSGVHCDVGGGSVSNGTKPNMARIPLRWMIRECFKTNTGILFDTAGLKRIGLDPSTLYPLVLPRPAALPVPPSTFIRTPKSPTSPPPPSPSTFLSQTLIETQLTEPELDLLDALSPAYDTLTPFSFWWILELVPLLHRYQRSRDNTWGYWFGVNWGEGRKIPRQDSHGVRVHRSVKTRMEAGYEGGGKYVPKADLRLDCVEWVD